MIDGRFAVAEDKNTHRRSTHGQVSPQIDIRLISSVPGCLIIDEKTMLSEKRTMPVMKLPELHQYKNGT
jgi:hypothetical protein